MYPELKLGFLIVHRPARERLSTSLLLPTNWSPPLPLQASAASEQEQLRVSTPPVNEPDASLVSCARLSQPQEYFVLHDNCTSRRSRYASRTHLPSLPRPRAETPSQGPIASPVQETWQNANMFRSPYPAQFRPKMREPLKTRQTPLRGTDANKRHGSASRILENHLLRPLRHSRPASQPLSLNGAATASMLARPGLPASGAPWCTPLFRLSPNRKTGPPGTPPPISQPSRF